MIKDTETNAIRMTVIKMQLVTHGANSIELTSRDET